MASIIRDLRDILGFYTLSSKTECTVFSDMEGFAHVAVPANHGFSDEECLTTLGELDEAIALRAFRAAHYDRHKRKFVASEADMESWRRNGYAATLDIAADEDGTALLGVPFWEIVDNL